MFLWARVVNPTSRGFGFASVLADCFGRLQPATPQADLCPVTNCVSSGPLQPLPSVVSACQLVEQSVKGGALFGIEG